MKSVKEMYTAKGPKEFYKGSQSHAPEQYWQGASKAGMPYLPGDS